MLANGRMDLLWTELVNTFALKTVSVLIVKHDLNIETVLSVAWAADTVHRRIGVHSLKYIQTKSLETFRCEAVDREWLVKRCDGSLPRTVTCSPHQLVDVGLENASEQRDLFIPRPGESGFPAIDCLLLATDEAREGRLAGDSGFLPQRTKPTPKIPVTGLLVITL
jgi:hypothetical protein